MTAYQSDRLQTGVSDEFNEALSVQVQVQAGGLCRALIRLGDLFGGAGCPSEDAVQQRLGESGWCVVGQSESGVPPVDLLDCLTASRRGKREFRHLRWRREQEARYPGQVESG